MSDPQAPLADRGRAVRRREPVPAFALYGEAASPALELLHIEEVQSRSRLYHWEIDPHVHHGLYQLVWVASGAAEVLQDEWREHVSGPAAVLIPPGTVHGFRFEPETQGLVLTLSARFWLAPELQSAGEAVGQLFAAPRVVRFDAGAIATRRLDALLAELAAEFLLPGTGEAPVLSWLARAALWRLAQACALNRLEHQGGRARRHQALFTRFVLLVEQRFLEHWPVARYASQLCISTARLNRLARAGCGRSAQELVHERLTREACRRLVYIAAPVAKLALELGFEDPAYFCRFFKRRTGLSPKQYREQRGA